MNNAMHRSHSSISLCTFAWYKRVSNRPKSEEALSTRKRLLAAAVATSPDCMQSGVRSRREFSYKMCVHLCLLPYELQDKRMKWQKPRNECGKAAVHVCMLDANCWALWKICESKPWERRTASAFEGERGCYCFTLPRKGRKMSIKASNETKKKTMITCQSNTTICTV